MTPQPTSTVPAQRLAEPCDADEQSVRRLADLVLGAAALADRLERAAADRPLDATCAERVARLRDFATWGSGAIDRAVSDDAYAHFVCEGPAGQS
jgi:hypothetical protein